MLTLLPFKLVEVGRAFPRAVCIPSNVVGSAMLPGRSSSSALDLLQLSTVYALRDAPTHPFLLNVFFSAFGNMSSLLPAYPTFEASLRCGLYLNFPFRDIYALETSFQSPSVIHTGKYVSTAELYANVTLNIGYSTAGLLRNYKWFRHSRTSITMSVTVAKGRRKAQAQPLQRTLREVQALAVFRQRGLGLWICSLPSRTVIGWAPSIGGRASSPPPMSEKEMRYHAAIAS